MNSKEIIENVVALKPLSRPAVSLLSGGAWALNKSGLSLENALNGKPEQMAEILGNAYDEVGSDIAWVGSGYNNLVIRALGGKIKFRKKGTPDVVEPLVKKASDVDRLDIGLLKEDVDLQFLFETTRLLTEKLGDRKLVGGSSWGPFTLTGLLYGAEQLMRDIYKDKEAVHHILTFSTELYLEYMRLYEASGARVLFLAEPSASGDMISRKHFQETVLPHLTEVYSRLDKPGIITGLHICGNTEGYLDLIPQTGAQILSVDYKVDLAHVRKNLDGKMAFAGNMNPVAVMQQSVPADVTAACLACRKQAGGHSGYIVMPGCDIPPTTPTENIKAMCDSVFLPLQ